MTTCPVEARMVAQINALLAAFASCTDYTSYWHTLRAVENQLRYLENNGRAGEVMDARPEFERINRVKAQMVNAQFAAIPTYSTAELIAMQQRFDALSAETNADLAKIATLHAETADMWSSPTLQAAE